ncbi:unnamed protein product, partial [Ascophyllum nodosum]
RNVKGRNHGTHSTKQPSKVPLPPLARHDLLQQWRQRGQHFHLIHHTLLLFNVIAPRSCRARSRHSGRQRAPNACDALRSSPEGIASSLSPAPWRSKRRRMAVRFHMPHRPQERRHRAGERLRYRRSRYRSRGSSSSSIYCSRYRFRCHSGRRHR